MTSGQNPKRHKWNNKLHKATKRMWCTLVISSKCASTNQY
ncbi:unnamed protein product [Amoebophrya sp. A120]|nr:unnamed protein product [Amoebophrya sp. A120]|eukprot:GSA120T00018784001.1